ncbi:S8 family serine peptidase [Corallococcus exiguus]|uniref:S8 family serine peptidase n=1 Tax=Corallococcus TaxID=83461 RepID=UPI000F869C0C|nr:MULTISPECIES: S8 family serine peptidase [Corallococcus]NNC17964.1 S8 family serine peptidase [Corallococcus exiguus]RUO89934.1 peptidase S8 [Corallococcus sp. AB018]
MQNMRKQFSTSRGGWRPVTALVLGCTLAVPAGALAAERPPSSATRAPAAPGAAVATALKAGGTTLATPSGRVFHQTARPVSGLRSLDVVRDTGVQLHVWRERQADGTERAFSAYTRGGSELLGRVQQEEYLIRLAEASFDPLARTAPLLGNALVADRDNTLSLVQFHGTPLPEYRETIENAGGKVLRFLSDHTYLVEMPSEVRARVSQLPAVRWVGDYHPEWRLEPVLRDALLGRAAALAPQRYSIMLGEGGAARQARVTALVERLGGKVDLVEPGGLRVEATLNQEQLASVARANEVQFIDRWGGPGEVDMDIVRETGGANYVQGLKGWNGQGVRGEIFDTELRTTHREWPTTPIIHSTGTSSGSLHGTSCYSHNFASGVDPLAKGILPGGQGIFFLYSESTQFGGTKSRLAMNQELLNPNGPYRAVFQTSSVGSTLTTAYTTISAEVDDYLFKAPLLSTQSQSNNGSRNSRPQAWAKNIVSVGGIRHYNTQARTDDRWSSGASIGPAADGRIKPDLAFYYDNVRGAYGSSDTAYTEFSGTSSATPQTAGFFGLLHQMWHEGVWAGHGKKADVFTSRPKMATAKALMINGASKYNWLAGGANADIDRNKQGWGTSDVKRLYDRAAKTFVVDETDVLAPLGSRTYSFTVASGEPELNVTMVYTDPMGTVGAARARINDLSLRVTAPNGTVYWGNNGLTAGNVSTSGGVSNKVDTVENVFLANPAAGTWKVEVLADEVVQDAHTATAAVDANYALVVSGVNLNAKAP